MKNDVLNPRSLGYTEKAVASARAARKKRWICFFIILIVLIIVGIVVGVVVANNVNKNKNQYVYLTFSSDYSDKYTHSDDWRALFNYDLVMWT